jgi:hypothetical protein
MRCPVFAYQIALFQNTLKKCNIPIATVIGGGYSPSDTGIAQRHLSIFRAAIDAF